MKEVMSNVLTKFERVFGLTVDDKGKVVTNSIRVAEYYGKQHKDVLEKIRGFITLIPQLDRRNFTLIEYRDERNRIQPMYVMDRQGFSMLVNKFTGDEATLFTYKYTQAFEEMAEEIADKKEFITAITNKAKTNKVLTLDDINAERFSVGRTIKTFANADMKTIDELVADFNEYVSKMDTRTRIKRAESAISGIQRLHDRLIEENPSNIGHCYNLKQLIIEIKDNKHQIENRKNGGLKAALKRDNNKYKDKYRELKKQITSLTPELEDYYQINYSGFSENSMYDYNEKCKKWVKSNVYKRWIANFPHEDMPSDCGIDWDRPIKMYLAFVQKNKTDCQNYIKSAVDQIFRHYGHDDYKIEDIDIRAQRIATVNNHSEGKIYFLLRNV